ncbi:sugar transferase [Prevotella melaninogenica]|uniref:sugar transferase n=1 Tax=Prevotella melaninogenica TaxID=28132 RepID=UPI001D137072|nr:sugar transferase [Prevotella melaninogenica]UEA98938.1 sugar transferase [Prevotella melaninogenica]
MYQYFFKRCFDIVLSLLALICISPILIVFSILLYFANNGAGVFFCQPRPGYKGKIFKVIKFKTMNDNKGPDGKLLPDAQRITRIGKFVRNSSIDELPQFFNVLKGDMSLIGPRPLLVKYLPLYSEEQARRHNVRPGISGWAQCHGRNSLSWTEKFKYDVWYVDNISFKTDCQIVWLTIKSVLLREGISHEGSATMEDFNGSN